MWFRNNLTNAHEIWAGHTVANTWPRGTETNFVKQDESSIFVCVTMPSTEDTDYQLRSGTSTINAGLIPTVPNLPSGLTYDYRHTQTRPINGIYDIGAYEYQQTSSILFSDDFSTDTISAPSDYTVEDRSVSGAGPGSFIYDSVEKRGQIVSADNVGVKFSHDLPSCETGTFSIDFHPTTNYPLGGWIQIRLIEDSGNYYELINSDHYDLKALHIRKVVDGEEEEEIDPNTIEGLNKYTQNNNYNIKITFSPNLTTVNAFGEILTLNTDSNTILVDSFEVETFQQDAYYDNILYTAPCGYVQNPGFETGSLSQWNNWGGPVTVVNTD